MKNFQSSTNWLVARLQLKTYGPISPSHIFKHSVWGFCTFLLVFFCLKPSQAREDQKTYFISLVKTAEIEVDNKKVLTQTYTVKKGDYLSKILKEKGLWKQGNLSELLSVLKKLNRSLRNPDLIHPGEKIIIPLKITPLAGDLDHEDSSLEKMTPITALKDPNFENYTVKPGDSIIKVAKGLYNIPPEDLFNEYIELVKELNPSIKDLANIYPDQIIRLPIYPYEIDREPIEAAISPKPEDKSEDERVSQKVNTVAHDLFKIFLEMGEEGVQSGEHFIPLKSGSLISLKATSFPIINLQNGQTVIVDLSHGLSEKMARLIESSWKNYRVIHLVEEDDLRSALDKILRVANYPRVFKRGEPFELQGDITFRITGDWIVSLPETRSDNRPSVFVINLMDSHTPNTPRMIKDYLEGLGVKVIDYPQGDDDSLGDIHEVEILKGGTDSPSLIKTVLSLIGRPFSAQVEIPVYQSHRPEFKLIIKADFFLKIKGRDAIIDLTGLEPEVISFLEDHKFLHLSLGAEKNPLVTVTKTLEFLDIQFDSGPHSFMATTRDDSRNIRLTLPGIIFSGPHGEAILTTPLNLPGEIAAFLSQIGYKIWSCPLYLFQSSQRSTPLILLPLLNVRTSSIHTPERLLKY